MKLKWLPDYFHAIKYNSARKIAPLLCVSLLITITEIAAIGIIFPIIQAFVDFEGFSQGKIALVLSNILGMEDMRDLSLMLVMIFMGVIIIRGALSYFGYKMIFHRISKDEADFAAEKFHKLLYKDYLSFQNTDSSKTIRDIAIAIPIGFSTVLQSLMIISSESLILLGIAVYLFILNPVVFLAILGILFIAALVYAKIISPILTKLGQERHDLSHKTIGIISQSLEGIMQIKNWQGERFFRDWFWGQRQKQGHITASLMAMQNVPRFYFETILMMGVCAAMAYALVNNIPTQDILPILGFYVVAAFRSMPSVLRLSAQANTISAAKPSIDTLLDLRARNTADYAEQALPYRVHETLELSGIEFSYEQHKVLNGATLNIKKGSLIGIAGRSGEGKTTLVNILTGLLAPDQGHISIDGDLIDAYQRLLASVGYVSQNTFILNDSVRANVAFGQNETDIDDAKVLEALRSAQLEDYVGTLQDGLYEKLGERGSKMSGGQKQRMGIARAFYFDRDILILDEATASLDAQTEEAFCDVLKTLKGQKTVLIISHKDKPLSVCDEVYDMNSGQLTLRQNQRQTLAS